MSESSPELFATLPPSLRDEVARQWASLDAGLLAGRASEAIKVFAASPWAMRICQRQPALLDQLIESGDLDRSYSPDRYDECTKELVEEAATRVEPDGALRRLRNRELLRIAWRDLTGAADLNETLADLSALAEACIDAALNWRHREACERHGTPRDANGNPQRLVVLGMGKLGGGELNFSSDVDLIFAYPEDGRTDGDRPVENQQFFIRLGQQLIKTLSETTAEGFVYRVDMRLRPFGEAGPLTASFDALEDYYQTHGREWERYALIKARPVAGDRQAGEELIARLRPFVYRRYLDYGVFESLREMKALIAAEVRKRGLQNNIKQGAGGIREIEFIGQAYQLLRGGRDRELQRRDIQGVLRRLGDEGQLPTHAVRQLLAAYAFLRRVENRLQMMEDRQVHTLPEDGTARARLAFAMNCESWDAFSTQIKTHRRRVHAEFERVSVAPQSDAAANGEDRIDVSLTDLWRERMDEERSWQVLEEAGFEDPQAALRTLAGLRPGYNALSADARERMDRLMPPLIAAAGRSEGPDAVLPRLTHLIAAVARRSVYLLLLAENATALGQLVKLMAASPWIAEHLTRHPILLDELLDPRVLYAPGNRTSIGRELREELDQTGPDDMEASMDRLRQFRHASVLRVAAADVTGTLPLMKVSDQLTWIAEAILGAAYDLARRQLTARFGRPRCIIDGESRPAVLGIIAYGKLGGIELGYGSDLDLVFLHNSRGERQITDGERSLDNSQFFARLSQRVIHILATPTSAGAAYEIDTRLRPDGAAGMLVASLDAFEAYQRDKAWTWEHQALVRARLVAGSREVADDFEPIRAEALARRRDLDTLRGEVMDMRNRMRRELGSHQTGKFDLKQDSGGIADIEFMVQYLVLAHAFEQPDLYEYTDNIRILEALARHGFLAPDDAEMLMDAFRGYRDKVHTLALQQRKAVVPEGEFADERRMVSRLWRELMQED